MANQSGGPGVGNPSNKRKRGAGDQEGAPASKLQNTNANGDHDPNNYGLLLQAESILSDDNTRTAQAALNAPGMNPSAYPEPGTNPGDPSLAFPFDDGSPTVVGMNPPQALVGAPRVNPENSTPGQKPPVGSTEWHQVRKDNHKEVERRRREVINEGIENIGKIVPGTEKNKGAILQRTYEYIQELLLDKSKFDNERATLDIALKELTRRLERMKESAQTAWAETKKWQGRCRDAGLPFDDYDDGGFSGLDEDDVVANLGS